MKVMKSLIVLQCMVMFCRGFTAVAPGPAVKFLGFQPSLGYAQESVSPSIYPLRTALDVLQPSVGYGYPWGLAGYQPGYYPAAPAPLAPFSFRFPAPVSVSPVTTVLAETPAAVAPEVVAEAAVDVAEEDEDTAAPVGEITIRDHIESLPSPPESLFRDQAPVIPAGIVQATQPHFVQAIFKNPKLSPSLQFAINSKVSPVLQEIKASGVELI